MLGWFAETALVAAVLALAVVLLSRLRSLSPTVRHALWLVVLIRLITPPLFSWPWATSWWLFERHDASIQVGAGANDRIAVGDDQARSARPHKEPRSTTSVVIGMDLFPSPVDVVMDEPHEILVEPAEEAAFSVHNWAWLLSLPGPQRLGRWVISAWLIGSVVLGVGQAIRIIRFSHRLRTAVPAPDELVQEADCISRRLSVSVPGLLVVPDLVTPLLWCLGHPQLLLPARLVKTYPFDRWRGILTHELAHLRRGDHWVSRLELITGLIWWWNPVYWLTRARLGSEAELACDAWVVWTLPKDRLAYAEVLFDVCATLSLAKPTSTCVGCCWLGPLLRAEIDHDLARPRPLPALMARFPRGLFSPLSRIAILVDGQAGRFRPTQPHANLEDLCIQSGFGHRRWRSEGYQERQG